MELTQTAFIDGFLQARTSTGAANAQSEYKTKLTARAVAAFVTALDAGISGDKIFEAVVNAVSERNRLTELAARYKDWIADRQIQEPEPELAEFRRRRILQ